MNMGHWHDLFIQMLGMSVITLQAFCIGNFKDGTMLINYAQIINFNKYFCIVTIILPSTTNSFYCNQNYIKWSLFQ